MGGSTTSTPSPSSPSPFPSSTTTSLCPSSLPPPPRLACTPPPPGSSPSLSSPSSPSSFSSSPSSPFSAYPRSLRLTPRMGVWAVEAAEVELGLAELLEQLLLPVASPLAPILWRDARGKRQFFFQFFIPRVNFLNLIFRTEK